jgi:putative phosphoribosyl transferase
MPFQDRQDAGRRIAGRLRAEPADIPLVIALPRGGVPIGLEVARELHAPMDVLVVRKIGAPDNPEYGLGAITQDGFRWIDTYRAGLDGITPEELEKVSAIEHEEVNRRLTQYRAGKPPLDVRGKTVIVVDDGLATGVTALVATRYLRQKGARKVILAVPVCSPSAKESLAREVDELICLEEPRFFYSVGQYYRDFEPVSDDEVTAMLSEADTTNARKSGFRREVTIPGPRVELGGYLSVPRDARGLVIFAHGSGSGRFSPRNQQVADQLNFAGFGTLLFDLLTVPESQNRENVFDIPLLAGRLGLATRWAAEQPSTQGLPIGYFGASTGAAAALWAAADLGDRISAVVSRGGRPDLAGSRLAAVRAPTLLIVGGEDYPVIEMNEEARRYLPHAELIVVPGATHLFEEPGTLEAVARSAIAWFSRYLAKHGGDGQQAA